MISIDRWFTPSVAVNNAIGYAKFRSRSDRALIRVYDKSGIVFETHEQKGDFRAF